MNKKIVKLFSDFISIKSVSTERKRHSEILKAADFLKGEIRPLGFEIDTHQNNNGSPLIIAKKIISKSAKTIGIYAHYDVQPEDPVEKWDSPPFKLTSKNGKLYGRGTADDKGHIIQTLTAIHQLIEKKALKNNIFLIFEGEEENESKNFEFLIKKIITDLKKIDVFYILDMGMKDRNIPQIFYGLRGIITGELVIKTGKVDLHSGIFGNRVLNPVQAAAELLAKIKDGKSHEIKIPKFYDSVKTIEKDEIYMLSKFDLTEEEEKKNAGVKEFVGDFSSSKISPSFEVNGILSGYTGDGAKTIIPSETLVKFSIRLIPDQKPEEIKKIVESFISDNLPKELDFDLKVENGCAPFYTDINNSYVKTTAKIFEGIFKNKTHFNRSGGSIAAAEVLQRLFGKPIILTGFTLPDENIHAPNENVDEEMFVKGVTALEKIISQ
jgi:acetylornithine deacetylase/succinyl-diaminopimelate desuccinylase-like protein